MPFRQVCLLVREGRVLVDPPGWLRWFEDDSPVDDLGRRVRACGDPRAVLVAPQQLVEAEPRALLSVFGSLSESSLDGEWAELDELRDPEPAVLAAVREAVRVPMGLAESPPHRPEWFATNWYRDVNAWVDTQLAAHGRSRARATLPVKVWSLSAVLKVPCEPGPLWFKASNPHFRAEPALTRLVSDLMPEHTPVVIATDTGRGWLLIEDLPGADEGHQDAPPAGLGAAAAAILANLQIASIDRLDEVLATGAPLRGLPEIRDAFDDILADSIELNDLTSQEVTAARAVRHQVYASIDGLADLAIPNTLVHGDLHPGNIALHGDSLVLYDWSDAAISHPCLDLVHLTRSMPGAEAQAARASYAAIWRAVGMGSEIERAIELADEVNTIYQAVAFEQIYRAQEAASYWEMRGVVSRTLRKLPHTVAERT